MTTGVFPMNICGNNQGASKVRKATGKFGQTSVLYDDDCMAACVCLGIYDRESAGFTFRIFM